MTRVVAYARSSSLKFDPKDQLDLLVSSLSSEARVVASFTDRCPGFAGPGPGLQRALDYVKNNPVDVVVVFSPDRLTRSITHLSQIKRSLETEGVRLHFLSARTKGKSRGREWT